MGMAYFRTLLRHVQCPQPLGSYIVGSLRRKGVHENYIYENEGGFHVSSEKVTSSSSNYHTGTRSDRGGKVRLGPPSKPMIKICEGKNEGAG